ncbi:MAG: hypothetical protein ACRCYS_11470 [Beijerinckiaceae bacterium]
MKPEEDYDPETGEIIESRTADGGRLPPPAATVADTIRLLADGQFDADISHELRELVRKMEAHAFSNKAIAKGKLTITLDITLANGAHVVTPSYKVTAPVQKQPGTLLFAFEDGRLSRNPPGQGALFGIRTVDGPREVRNV